MCDINKAFSTWQSALPEYHVQYKPQERSKEAGYHQLSVLTPTVSRENYFPRLYFIPSDVLMQH